MINKKKDAGNRTLCPYRNFSQAIKAFIALAKLIYVNRNFDLKNLWIMESDFLVVFSSMSDLTFCGLTCTFWWCKVAKVYSNESIAFLFLVSIEVHC